MEKNMDNGTENDMETGGISRLPLLSWEWRNGKEHGRLFFWSNCFGSTVGARIRTNAMLMYPAALNADCIQGI